MKPRAYPSWACVPCGKEHGSKAKARLVSCSLYGKCDVCGKNNYVTDPSDFGHFKNWFKT
jgi:hypothetical protein